MQSINHADSNGDVFPPNGKEDSINSNAFPPNAGNESPKCDSEEINDLESSRGLALRRKSTFGQRSTKSKVLLIHLYK